MKVKKRLASVLAAAVMAANFAVPAHAESDSETKSMKNSSAKVSYNSTYWGQSNFWDVWWGANGNSKTVWYGANPYNADSIIHQNILSCSGIGSMSVGISPSGPNASVSISGHSATYSYSVSNNWRLEVNYNYKHTGLLAAWNYSTRAAATIQFGTQFYSWST